MKLGEMKLDPPMFLIHSDPGAGKTCFITTLGAKLQMLDLDIGRVSAVKYQDQWTDTRAQVDVIPFDNTDLFSAKIWEDFRACITKIVKENKEGSYPFKILGIEGLTCLTQAAFQYVMVRSGRRVLRQGQPVWGKAEYQHWGQAIEEVMGVMRQLKSLPIPVIMTAHSRFIDAEGEDEKKMVKRQVRTLNCYGKNLPGMIVGMFDEVLYMEVAPAPGGRTKHLISSTTDPDVKKKTRWQIPNDFDTSRGMDELFNQIGYSLEQERTEKCPS